MIRYLAIDVSMLWDWETIWGRDEQPAQECLLNGLKQVFGQMESLKELIEVYTLKFWASHCLWKGVFERRYPDPPIHPRSKFLSRGSKVDAKPSTDDQRLVFFDQLPVELQTPELDIEPNLPESPEFFSHDDAPKFRSVFGMRKKWRATSKSPKEERGPRLIWEM